MYFKYSSKRFKSHNSAKLRTSYNLAQTEWNIWTTPPPIPNFLQNGAFLLVRAFTIALGGRGLIVPFFLSTVVVTQVMVVIKACYKTYTGTEMNLNLSKQSREIIKDVRWLNNTIFTSKDYKINEPRLNYMLCRARLKVKKHKASK